MKKAKNPMSRFRSAIRLIWSRSAERKAILKAATDDNKCFTCPLCNKLWPIQMADVDHDPAIGQLNSIDELSDFTRRMFYGSQRAICKLCHKIKTASDRRKK
jgi:transcription elongation factor Elf1